MSGAADPGRSRRRRRTAGLVVVAVVLLPLASCRLLLVGIERRQSAASAVETRYLEHLRDGRYGEAFDLLCTRDVDRATFVRLGEQADRQDQGLAEIDFLFRRVEGGVQVSHYDLTYDDGVVEESLLHQVTRPCLYLGVDQEPVGTDDHPRGRPVPRGVEEAARARR